MRRRGPIIILMSAQAVRNALDLAESAASDRGHHLEHQQVKDENCSVRPSRFDGNVASNCIGSDKKLYCHSWTDGVCAGVSPCERFFGATVRLRGETCDHAGDRCRNHADFEPEDGKIVWIANQTARLNTTPTTAAVIAEKKTLQRYGFFPVAHCGLESPTNSQRLYSAEVSYGSSYWLIAAWAGRF